MQRRRYEIKIDAHDDINKQLIKLKFKYIQLRRNKNMTKLSPCEHSLIIKNITICNDRVQTSYFHLIILDRKNDEIASILP